MSNTTKTFNVYDGDENVFGQPLPRENSHLQNIVAYPMGDPAIDDLEIGQESYAKFSSCGVTGTYKIVRVS